MSGVMRKFDDIEKIAHKIKRAAAKRFFKDLEELRRAKIR